MRIELDSCVIRSYRPDDADELAYKANNKKIWRNLRDGFPHPYRIEDAHRFLKMVAEQDPETFFCISIDDRPVGGIGFSLQSDVHRFTAEIGYWLAEELWGRGIATQALTALTRYAIDTHRLVRVYATPYQWSQASCRVLEKAGYVLEGRLKNSVFKDGQYIDQLMYACTEEPDQS
jgi:RimJ/RimL family protein N-acetyltransferase